MADLGAPRLIGGRGTLASDSPVKTVESYWPYASTLFDYIHRAMPMDAPGSLSADEVYAVSAYILGQAGITPVNQMHHSMPIAWPRSKCPTSMALFQTLATAAWESRREVMRKSYS